ncbi:MAG: type II toxin-antitoxin system mRNA interferase toxin, RelE/StbE family [Pasteurellaceae bacterium]|nr:type II toxin-antitoxin system mRNA interferase toxin, RelE/StbE family [Pasteurellaceae bacterium]
MLNRQPLPARYQDHQLTGEWKFYRDCHIQGDLVLIYKYLSFDDYDEIRFARLNTHSALFI